MLDFPYAYKLDGNKLYCNEILEDGSYCGGIIDYDDGFNHLRCTKCGKKYKAVDLKKAVDDNTVIRKGEGKMKVSFGYGDLATSTNDSTNYMNTAPKFVPRKKGKKSKVGTLKVQIMRGNKVISEEEPEKEEVAEESKLIARGTVVNSGGPTINSGYEEADETVEAEDVVSVADYIGDTESATVSTIASDDSEELGETEAGFMSVNGEPVNETYEEDPLYLEMAAESMSSADIDGVEEGKFKCYRVCYPDNTEFKVGSVSGSYIVIRAINGVDVSDICVLKKDAYEKLKDGLENAKKRQGELTKKNKELNVLCVSHEQELNVLQKKYDDLVEEMEVLKDNVPWFIDEGGVKREKVTGKFWGKNGPKKSDPTDEGVQSEFKVKSPLLDEDKHEEESVQVEIPVGAAPPVNEPAKPKTTSTKKTTTEKKTSTKSTSKRSDKFNPDSDYYKTASKKK